MSGLQNFYNTANSYGSNKDSMTNFLGQYQQDALGAFNDAVAGVREQGKALVETGTAIEGQYAAGKTLYKTVQAYRNRGKKPGNETGDEDNADDNTEGTDSTDASPTGGADDSSVPGTDDVAAVTPDDVATVTADDVPAGGGTQTGDVSNLGASDTPLDQTAASRFTADPVPEPEPPGNVAGYDAPEDAVAQRPSGLSSGGELQSLDEGGQLASSESTTAAGTETVTATGTDVGTSVGTTATEALTEGGGDVAAGLLAGAGVAVEAVPVLGGLAAIGIGLYELFHHASKPAPLATPQSLISQKGEMVVPSFDSVTDTPASQAAF
tara:strand:- start:427 stop:1398 length:972 start_codon:yes stop_codon:yes gene_type:complete